VLNSKGAALPENLIPHRVLPLLACEHRGWAGERASSDCGDSRDR
jgi:hypothetical protein